MELGPPTFVTAHPNAKKLLKESFYWDPIEETAPFGNDLGYDAYYSFAEWNQKPNNGNIINLLNQLIDEIGVASFDIKSTDAEVVKKYITRPTEVDTSMIDMVIEQNKKSASFNNSPKNNKPDEEIRKLLIESASQRGNLNLLSIDNIIIGLGYSQFVQSGKIDAELKSLTAIAIQRQLLPLILETWPEDYKEIRKEQLEIMLSDVNDM